MTVESMANFAKDGTKQSPTQCLEDALKHMAPGGGNEGAKKCLVIVLDDDGKYNVGWYQAGMKMSECISLLRVAEQLFLAEMDYANMPSRE